MKQKNLYAFAICMACLEGCTFRMQTLPELLDQSRLTNEEAVALRECEKNSGAIGSLLQCQQRAKSWRGASVKPPVLKSAPENENGTSQE